jgi:hypothetical protein
MPDPGLAERAAAAARMLLLPPDAATLAALAPVADGPLDPERARQDFYDFLCVPQSGCYVPPYAHVLARAERNGEYWFFPPPRFDGGDGLRGWYETAGFDPAALEVDPLIGGANRPLDHMGFVFAFLAGLLQEAATTPEAASLVAEFAAEALGRWAERWVELLTLSGSPYITLLGSGLAELLAELRAAFPLPAAAAEEA